MWPFTKKTEKKETVIIDKKETVEKNERLICAKEQIQAQLTKFSNTLRDKNLT